MPEEQQRVREYLRQTLAALSRNPRVLVVDDDANDRFLVSQILNKYHCHIVECVSSEMAIYTISHDTFDIIFLDVKMPPGDGVEVLKKIRELNPKQTVIVMSGYDDVITREKVLDLGPQLIWRKPIKAKDIDEIFNILDPRA